MFYNATIIIGLRTAQHIKQCTTPKGIIKITVVQDILESHRIVSVSEFCPSYSNNAFFILPLMFVHAGVCPSLPLHVSHGKVIVTSTFVGGTASYSCSPGYRVDGAAVLICQSHGSWNNTIPTCRRK